MAHLEADKMRSLIVDIARQYDVGRSLEAVNIRPGLTADDEDTLRINVQVKDLEKANLSDLKSFIEAVENSLIEYDDRIPSIRFSEAA